MRTASVTAALLAACTSIAVSGPKEPVPPGDSLPEELALWEAIRPIVDLRARYEFRSQDGRDDAHAGTVRGRLGFVLDNGHGLSALAEYEGTLPLDRSSYQAASVHGLGRNKAIVADPESHELNRLWLGYEGFDTRLKFGRQRINLGNQRFVGTVGWRQNEQTFDAVSIENRSLEDLTLHYSYVSRVKRIFGSGPIANPAQHDFEGNTHLANVKCRGIENTVFTAYAYWMDLHNTAGDANSNRTFGASVVHSLPVSEGVVVPLRAEYAYQEEAFDSPLDYGATYYHVSAGVQSGGYGLTVGYESLNDDNGVGFRTPLATLHKFNGFADTFLATPDRGLGDLYLSANALLPGGFVFKPTFHWFGEAGGGLEYGKEIDAVLVRKINERLTVLAKYAHYFADDFAGDTAGFTLQMGYVY